MLRPGALLMMGVELCIWLSNKSRIAANSHFIAQVE